MRVFAFFLLLVLFSCIGQNDLPGFDESAWKQDKNGCNKVRLAMAEELSAVMEDMKGLSENELLDLLGSPDINQLYKRNQKFYIYHMTPSLECGTTGNEKQLFLEIRFSATNLAREVMIKESGLKSGE